MADVFETVATRGVGLGHGAVALGQGDKMGERWRSGPALGARDFGLAELALGLLLQAACKVLIAQIQLTFQFIPDAGQADTGAHMVDVSGNGRDRLTAKLGQQPAGLEPLGRLHAAHHRAIAAPGPQLWQGAQTGAHRVEHDIAR